MDEATERALNTILDNQLRQRTQIAELSEKLDEYRTRIEVLEYFVREKFPGDFAGVVGTVADPALKPIEITFGEPQERFNEQTLKWERRNEQGVWEAKEETA